MALTKLSFVIPCYYSEATIAKVVEGIDAAVKKAKKYNHEIILVNDGSKDKTFEIISHLAEKNAHITGIDLSKNFGQASAIMAAYKNVSGDIVINLDDDGQNDPEDFMKLVGALSEDIDVVFARYPEKKHNFFRNFGSRINDIMATILIKKPKNLVFTSFFCARRYIVDEILKYENAYPYIDGLIIRVTDRVTAVDVPHHQRETGVSGYSFTKLISLWLNGFTAFSVKPLRIATVVGFLVASIGFVYGVYVIIRAIMGYGEAGWPSLMAVQVFMGGVMMMMLGLAGEYIGRIYISQSKAPQYVVRDIVKKERTDESERY